MSGEEKIVQMLEQLQQGQTEMRADMTEMRAEMTEMRADIDKLNKTVASIEVDHGFKLGALYDAHVDTLRNAATIGALGERVADHGHRIYALEQKASNG